MLRISRAGMKAWGRELWANAMAAEQCGCNHIRRDHKDIHGATPCLECNCTAFQAKGLPPFVPGPYSGT